MSYSPMLGRFLQRDPLGHVDRLDPYEREMSNPTSMLDAGGQMAEPTTPDPAPQVTISLNSKFVGACGYVNYKFTFELAAPASTAGWIIQEMTFSRRVFDDAGNPVSPEPDQHYWEAFPVAARSTKAGAAMKLDAGHWIVGLAQARPDFAGADTYRHLGEDNTRGTVTWRGTAFFLADPILPSGFQVGTVGMAGNIPSTQTDPKLPSTMGGTQHNMSVTWDCTCHSKYRFTRVAF